MSLSDLFSGPQLGQFGGLTVTVRSGSQWTATLMGRTPVIDGPPTFIEVEDLKWSALTVTDELDGPGNAQLSVSLDDVTDTSKARLRDLLRSPSELWVYRDGEQVYAGPVIARGTQGRRLDIASQGCLFYLGGMVLDVDYIKTAEDQATMVAELIGTFQALEYGHFGLDTSQLLPSGVTRQLTVLAVQGTPIDRPIREMGARDNGYDLWCRPSDRRVFTLSPQRGADLSLSLIIDSRQVTASSFSASIAAGQVGSDAICTSSAMGGPALIARSGDPVLRAQWGRWMVAATSTNITQQATLDAHARQLSADTSAQVLTIGSTLLPIDLTFGTIGPGDRVTFDYDDGLGQQSYIRRIRNVTAQMGDATERLHLEFV